MKAFIAKIVAAYDTAVNFLAKQYLALIYKHVEIGKQIGAIQGVKKQIGAAILMALAMAIEIIIGYYAMVFLMLGAFLLLSLIFSGMVALVFTMIGFIWFMSDLGGAVMVIELQQAIKPHPAA